MDTSIIERCHILIIRFINSTFQRIIIHIILGLQAVIYHLPYFLINLDHPGFHSCFLKIFCEGRCSSRSGQFIKAKENKFQPRPQITSKTKRRIERLIPLHILQKRLNLFPRIFIICMICVHSIFQQVVPVTNQIVCS